MSYTKPRGSGAHCTDYYGFNLILANRPKRQMIPPGYLLPRYKSSFPGALVARSALQLHIQLRNASSV
jgi:hypothetical protein